MARYLLTLPEVSRLMGHHKNWAGRLVAKGQFPLEVIEDMGLKQVRRADLESFLHLEPGELAVAS